MKSIFNEIFIEKRGLWVSWIVHETHWIVHRKLTSQRKKKKKKPNRQTLGTKNAIQTGT